MNYKIVRYVIWALTLVFAVGFALKYKEMSATTANVHNAEGQSVTGISLGAPFSLTNQNGKRVKSSDTDGKIRIVYFGYTFCPDLCPMALTNITDALHKLERDRDQVATYFITIDPQRDTISKLKEYSENFHPSIQMLHGSDEELKPVIKGYKVVVQKVEDEKLSDYLIDHSTFIYILDKKGMVVDILPHTSSGEKIMQALIQQIFYKKQD